MAGCADTTESIHEGRYVFGHEVHTFQPCGRRTTYWVVGGDSTTAALRAAHDSLTSRPYEPIYVRIRGAVVPGRGDGFALDYDGLFRIDTVLARAAPVPTACRAVDASDTPGGRRR